MSSVLMELQKLRNSNTISINRSNTNRYCVMIDEANGSKTIYGFSVPIYNVNTKHIIDRLFHFTNGVYCAYGSNATVTDSDNIVVVENKDNLCRVLLQERIIDADGNRLCYESFEIIPTLNGVAFKAKYKPGVSYAFRFVSGMPFMHVRENDKYFAFMKCEYLPLASVSCIGVFDENDILIAPCKISSYKNDDCKYTLNISSKANRGKYIMWELNMYEFKLFQDTTVEQNNPQLNNAFGGMAFVGITQEYGEQMLYSKPDFSIIPEIFNSKIHKAVLHIPQYNRDSNSILSVFNIESRFCSFGSNWENKIDATNKMSVALSHDSYLHIDIKSLLCEPDSDCYKPSDGFVLKASHGAAAIAISTGDNYYAPQIIELGLN